jgi:UDP-N-acetylmuramoyl-L-alanyl-D-glutamate--2,6-diaminopimelate ligase
MQLSLLLSRVATRETRGDLGVEISSLCYDSRQAKPGALFVAMQGERVDGHAFIAAALERGAAALVVERFPENVPAGIPCILVENGRVALASLAAFFYHQPALRLKVAGVTGTNGKTTTTYLLKHICERAVLRCGLIGTVRYEIADELLPSPHTTPESLDLEELLARMRDAGCKAAVLEVSSHAIAQGRVLGVEFDVAVFTNLTQDHLDFHGDLQSYFETKASFFTHFLPAQLKKRGVSVINSDDRYGMELCTRLAKVARVLTYGVGNRADFRASNFKTELAGTSYQLDAQDRSFLVRLPLIGKFNIYNSLAALAAATAMGVPLRAAVLALATAPAVPGRLELVPAKRNFQVYVDYAHTDDALHNVLRTLRELNPHRLIVVFGCGGDRDRAKRPLMGRAAEQWSDHVIVTSDNPRTEDPAAITRDIEKGFQGGKYEVILDRRAAIERAIGLAESRDIVLIAGKGHEDYQEFASGTVPFDDVQVARAAIEARPVELV